MKEITKETIKQNRKIWRDALRSGEFKQCQHQLKSTENGITSYCCLGVARKVIPGVKRDEGEEVLNRNSCRLLGIRHDSERGSYSQCVLSKMNDDGRSFKYIAAYIRKMPIILE